MNNEDLEDLVRFVALDMAGNVCDDRGMTDQNTDPIIYHVFCHTPWGPKCAGRMLYHELADHVAACPHQHRAEAGGHCPPRHRLP